MQENHLIACIRYIGMNPVRAKLVKAPEKWQWSSAAAHISGQNDELVNSRALLRIIKKDWKSFLIKTIDTETIEIFRKHERTGRPSVMTAFLKK
jgi:putative transposase